MIFFYYGIFFVVLEVMIRAKIGIDDGEIEHKIWVDHIIEWLLIGFTWIGFTTVAYTLKWFDLKEVMVNIVTSPFVWWLLFDMQMNISRDLPIDYVSTPSSHSSLTDDLLFKFKAYQWWIRGGCLAAILIFDMFYLKVF